MSNHALNPLSFVYLKGLSSDQWSLTCGCQIQGITSIHLQVVPNVQKLGTESRANDLNFSLAKLGSWSKDSNLALNPVKTKYMVLSTQQMSAYHKLADRSLNLAVGKKPLERVDSTRLLGVHINSNLTWDDHV